MIFVEEKRIGEFLIGRWIEVGMDDEDEDMLFEIMNRWGMVEKFELRFLEPLFYFIS